MQENKLLLHFYYKVNINTLYAEKKIFQKELNEWECWGWNGMGRVVSSNGMWQGDCVFAYLFITACFTYRLSPGQLTGATGLLVPQTSQKPGIVVFDIYILHIHFPILI